VANSLYFEDSEVGQSFESGGRTITELDPGKSEQVGRLGRRFVMMNQRDEIVQDGMSDLLIKKRAAQ
jgi:hypothetical protein